MINIFITKTESTQTWTNFPLLNAIVKIGISERQKEGILLTYQCLQVIQEAVFFYPFKYVTDMWLIIGVNLSEDNIADCSDSLLLSFSTIFYGIK